ncbi:MAG TPA: DUF5313 family protein [Mycobacteriales bacterium]|nr:DUF5313 family protein [Mycobacteriales bacterium]
MPQARRPGPLRWVWYAFGGRLPDSCRDWVQHDLTDADWRWRGLVRIGVQILIPVVGLLFLPGPWSIRIFTAAIVVFGAAFAGAAYGEPLRDRRLAQHGLPPVD